MSEPHNHWSMESALQQLDSLSYECEAGPLKHSDAFIWLKQAAKVGPEFWPGQGVYFKVKAEAAGRVLEQWMHFYIVACYMTSDTERRYWKYSLSYDPPAPYHYGATHFEGISGGDLRLEHPLEQLPTPES